MLGRCSKACEASNFDRLSVGVFVGFLWMSMDVHGRPWTFMGIHERPWTSMDACGVHGPMECSRAHEAGSVEAGSVDKLSVGAFVCNQIEPGMSMDVHG